MAARTLIQHPTCPYTAIYTNNQIIPRFYQLAKLKSVAGSPQGLPVSLLNIQIYIATILAHACKTNEEQKVLADTGIVEIIYCLLSSKSSDVVLYTLEMLSCLICKNPYTCELVVKYKNKAILNRLFDYMKREHSVTLQLSAARCITYLYKCGQMDEKDKRIRYIILPCVVRMTKENEPPQHRILAANTLAYLIDNST